MKAFEGIVFNPGALARTWISCHAAPDRTACAAFIEESRMKFVNATKLNRKSREPGAPVRFPEEHLVPESQIESLLCLSLFR
jgi:hypothetical protein